MECLFCQTKQAQFSQTHLICHLPTLVVILAAVRHIPPVFSLKLARSKTAPLFQVWPYWE